MGRDVPPKGVQFSESVWDGGIFHCTNSGKGLKYTCLERGPCLSGKDHEIDKLVPRISLKQFYIL